MSGQGFEDVVPDPLPAPAVETVIDRRVRPVLNRAIPPSRTRLEHVHDARKHAAIIHPPRTPSSPGKVRFDPSPRVVVQPVKLAHPKLPSRNLESQHQSRRQNLLSTDPRRPKSQFATRLAFCKAWRAAKCEFLQAVKVRAPVCGQPLLGTLPAMGSVSGSLYCVPDVSHWGSVPCDRNGALMLLRCPCRKARHSLDKRGPTASCRQRPNRRRQCAPCSTLSSWSSISTGGS